ncbi:MAG: zinc-ribbon domain, partial [Nitrospirae bacterium]|nr:zinc-ribbon domain [Nitrospirota bacterium]
MNIRCPSCSKLFRVADEKIAGKGIRFKCSKCAEVITITKDDFEMDLLAREAETIAPTAQPSAPALKPVPPSPSPPPTPQSNAQEYKPQEYRPPAEQPADERPAEDQQIPPVSLGDFDFSEPHAAASSAAHPAEGFGGPDFSFDASQEQVAPEIEISPEAAAEAEAALQF